MVFFSRLRKKGGTRGRKLKKDHAIQTGKFNDWTSVVYREYFVKFGR